jgi:hypothetical protein
MIKRWLRNNPGEVGRLTITLVVAAYALFSIYKANQANIENTKKVRVMLEQVNAQVDRFIAQDEEVYKNYIENVRSSIQSLSDKEKEMVLSVLEVEQQRDEE